MLSRRRGRPATAPEAGGDDQYRRLIGRLQQCDSRTCATRGRDVGDHEACARLGGRIPRRAGDHGVTRFAQPPIEQLPNQIVALDDENLVISAHVFTGGPKSDRPARASFLIRDSTLGPGRDCDNRTADCVS